MLIQIHKNLKLIKNLWGRHGQKWMSLRRLKVDSVIFGGGLVKDGSGLLVHETLKTLVLYLKNEYMKWADVLNADSDAIVSG